MNPLIRRIKLIDNRTKEEDLRLDLYETLIPYLLSVEVFKNNADVKGFIDLLLLQTDLKDYVYKSRTQIVARIAREIQRSDKDTLMYNVNVLKNHALDSENKEDKSKKNIVDMLNKYSRNK